MKALTLGLAALLLALSASCNKGVSTKDSGISVGQAPAAGAKTLALNAGDKAEAGTCAECGKPEAECVCPAHGTAACPEGKDCKGCPGMEGKEAAAGGCPAGGAKSAGGECPAGGDKAAQIAKTGDGIRIVDATAVDVDPAPYCGRVALHGKVGDVFSEKGTFTLVDLKKMPGCTDGCCPKTNIPINVPQAAFSGSFPKAGDEVLVVCTLSTTQTGGYKVEVEEVRAGDKTLLKHANAA